MDGTILAINAGSSSIKFALYPIENDGIGELELRGNLDLGDEPRMVVATGGGTMLADRSLASGRHPEPALAELMDFLDDHARTDSLRGVGHRIVHGGRTFSQPVLLTTPVIEALEGLDPLAPLHQLRSLMPVRALSRLRPGVPQVGCFDTAFHGTIAPLARRIALPRRFEEAGIRRYGFHGLSYEYIAGRLREIIPASHRTIVAHLGNGASMCAMRNGISIDTTMGFSALDGLVMGTRCGSIDPGVLLYLLDVFKMSTTELGDLLYRQSGLLGVSGISGDVRTLVESDDPRAREALDLFAFRAAREAAALASTLEGLDCLVFTAGVGENAASIRAAICARLGWLGVRIDAARNASGMALISADESDVRVWVIPTDEENVLAKHTIATLS